MSAPGESPDQTGPVFIRGMQRSGTTILVRLLRNCGFAGFAEGHLWDEVLEALSRLRDETYPPVDVLKKRGFALGEGRDVRFERAIAQMIDRFFREELHAAERRWFDKAPGIYPLQVLPMGLQLFPYAQIVFVHRNGISAVNSALELWGQRDPSIFDQMCFGWSGTMRTWRRLLPLLEANALELSQEEMATRPEAVADRLTDFLGCAENRSVAAATLAEVRENTAFPQLAPGAYGSGVGWSADQKKRFATVCGSEMEAWGYELDFESPSGPTAEPHPDPDAITDERSYHEWLRESLFELTKTLGFGKRLDTSPKWREQHAKFLRMEELTRQLEVQTTQLQSERYRLHQVENELATVYSSRSWRITAPMRKAALMHRLWTGGFGLDPASLRPFKELLPGEPFRQVFQPPVREFQQLGVCMFTYARPNDTRVRVRLLAGSELVHEQEYQGDEVQDGKMSLIELERPWRRNIRQPLTIEVEALDGTEGKTITVALAPPYYWGRVESEPGNEVLALDFAPPVPITTAKAFAFISGCPGDAYRYRCVHQGEMLRLSGYSVDVFPADEFPWDRLPKGYRVIVAHRVPHTPQFEHLIAAVRARGGLVVFDADDLVFDPDILPFIDALRDMTPPERELYANGVRRYRKSLSLCDAAMMSTERLETRVQEHFPHIPVAISRNRLSDENLAGAEAARKIRPDGNDDTAVRIAYLSGTRTHRLDFQECVSALVEILAKYPGVQLVLVGHIDVPPELDPFADRIEYLPLMDWRALPEVYQGLHVNLAPLERDNDFTDGKSELKYLEAGIVGVPTVASNVGGYAYAIDDGLTGFLCDDHDDWVRALTALIEDPDLRRAVGARAERDVRQRYLTRSAAPQTVETWRDLLGHLAQPVQHLTVAFVLLAPIAQTGGGYKKIFQLAHHLADQGHDVHIYVEPVAHLEGYSEEQVRSFCGEHFGTSAATVHLGHGEIAECDVAVATNWPTAPVVDSLINARLRTYFVQDYEPEFFGERDPARSRAEATYDLPLLMISIGRYLATRLGERNLTRYPHIDFALAAPFFEDRDDVEAKLDRDLDRDSDDGCSVLFFARPEIPRRGFDLGVKALTLVHAVAPEVEIRLYGMEEARKLPFPYRNLGVIDQDAVAREMRAADVHLSFSRSNASTVIFEAMASGCAAVELDEPGVRALIDDPTTCRLVEADPDRVAAALLELVRDPTLRRSTARAGMKSVQHLTVENMASQFEQILLEAVLPGLTAPHDS